MAGHGTPALSDDQIRADLGTPNESAPLTELARDKGQAVILFDDQTRPAPASRIFPFGLKAFEEAECEDDRIRFLGAFANHFAMSCRDLAMKTGQKQPRCWGRSKGTSWEKTSRRLSGRSGLNTKMDLLIKNSWVSSRETSLLSTEPWSSAF